MEEKIKVPKPHFLQPKITTGNNLIHILAVSFLYLHRHILLHKNRHMLYIHLWNVLPLTYSINTTTFHGNVYSSASSFLMATYFSTNVDKL